MQIASSTTSHVTSCYQLYFIPYTFFMGCKRHTVSQPNFKRLHMSCASNSALLPLHHMLTRYFFIYSAESFPPYIHASVVISNPALRGNVQCLLRPVSVCVIVFLHEMRMFTVGLDAHKIKGSMVTLLFSDIFHSLLCQSYMFSAESTLFSIGFRSAR